VLHALFQYSRDIRREKQHEFLGSATSNVTIINGGTAANIIPAECTAIIDRRVLPGETNEVVIQELLDLLYSKVENVDFELINLSFLPASIIDENHEFVQKALNAIDSYHETTEIKAFKATCEAPFFSIEKNIPTIIYGPGTLDQAH